MWEEDKDTPKEEKERILEEIFEFLLSGEKEMVEKNHKEKM